MEISNRSRLVAPLCVWLCSVTIAGCFATHWAFNGSLVGEEDRFTDSLPGWNLDMLREAAARYVRRSAWKAHGTRPTSFDDAGVVRSRDEVVTILAWREQTSKLPRGALLLVEAIDTADAPMWALLYLTYLEDGSPRLAAGDTVESMRRWFAARLFHTSSGDAIGLELYRRRPTDSDVAELMRPWQSGGSRFHHFDVVVDSSYRRHLASP